MNVCILVSAICILISPGFAGPPGFDLEDVVRQVRSAHSTPGPLEPLNPALDDGEFLIDTSSTLAPAPNGQRYAALAFDGTNFLAVWLDGRNGSGDIYGARVTPAGVVLDPQGIVISAAANSQYRPALAFDGWNFLVVWRDDRSGSYSDIYGARVTPQGTVLDPAGFVVSQAANDQDCPALAFDGTNFLAVWRDGRNGSGDIYGARVAPAGVVLDPGGLTISTAADLQMNPALAFDGTNFIAVWGDYRSGSDCDIYGARVTPAGVVLDTAGFAVSTAPYGQHSPALAFDGANFLVVWEDDDDIYGARVTPAGAVLDTTGIAISAATNDQIRPAVVFDGTDFLAVWADRRSGPDFDIYGARVTQAGVVLDAAGIAISTTTNAQDDPAVASDGATYFCVWDDERSSSSDDIYGARVTSAGVVLDSQGIGVATAAYSQESPGLAFDGDNFLVVWEDYRNGLSYDIYGARVTPAGVVLDSAGIAVSTAASWQESPAVAFDGTNYLVVWHDDRSGSSDIYGSRVSRAGAVLDTADIVISTAANHARSPALAFDGANYLVVWRDSYGGKTYIYGARVTPAGVVLDSAGIAVSTAARWQESHAVAFDGTNYLVVWQDSRDWLSNDIYGSRVSRAGVVLDTADIIISAAAGHQELPALASDGANSLVVWQDYRNGQSYDIYGSRVTPAGAVLDTAGIAISTAADPQTNPALAFDGENCLVAWQDTRSGSSDIYGARVGPDGTVFGKGAVVSQVGNQRYPALGHGLDNEVLLAYQGWVGAFGGKTYNTERIWGKMNPSPAVAEMLKPEVRMTNGGATIIRGLLMMNDRGQKTGDRAELLDISGRKVLELHTGANDVRSLAPGVYFVRAVGGRLSAASCQKVIVTR